MQIWLFTHLLSIFNASFVNVKHIYIVSLGWYHLASACISSIHASYLKFLYFTHIFHNCPIHCFHTFILFWGGTVLLPEISAQFLTQASKLRSSLHVLSEPCLFMPWDLSQCIITNACMLVYLHISRQHARVFQGQESCLILSFLFPVSRTRSF